MSISSEIQAEEFIGRQVMESRVANKLRKSKGSMDALPRGLFVPKKGSPTISVDRMLGDPVTMTAVGDANAAMRTDGVRNFQGWAVCFAGDAERNGRKIVSSPRTLPPANPYHADIWLPKQSAEYYSNNLLAWRRHVENLRTDLIGCVQWKKRHSKKQ